MWNCLNNPGGRRLLQHVEIITISNIKQYISLGGKRVIMIGRVGGTTRVASEVQCCEKQGVHGETRGPS